MLNISFTFIILNVRTCQQEDGYESYVSFCVAQSLMSSSKEEMRELAALFYSVVVSTVPGNELKSMIEQLIKATKDNHVCYPFIFIFLYYLNKTTLHFDKIYKPVSETQ